MRSWLLGATKFIRYTGRYFAWADIMEIGAIMLLQNSNYIIRTQASLKGDFLPSQDTFFTFHNLIQTYGFLQISSIRQLSAASVFCILA